MVRVCSCTNTTAWTCEFRWTEKADAVENDFAQDED